MLYWGTNGVPRDMSLAREFYMKAANHSSVTLHDWGIYLLKTEKNQSGLVFLERAAEQVRVLSV